MWDVIIRKRRDQYEEGAKTEMVGGGTKALWKDAELKLTTRGNEEGKREG